jgi:hypothetical protein
MGGDEHLCCCCELLELGAECALELRVQERFGFFDQKDV